MATNQEAKPNRKAKINKLRYTEYYDQQETLDGLYATSAEGKSFDNLMPLITADNNILKAYRTLKSNKGSNTAGTDKLTIRDIECLTAEEVCGEVKRRLQGYQPKAVRRKEIPKPNGKTRPLGIPCIWDRLIQQCILQILEPICEARFSDSSYGFRPLRSTEHAIAATMKYMNQSKLGYIVEIDIKSFFDEVDHPKLLRQIWAMGIRDLKLISILRAILVAPIQLENGQMVVPTKGTPQGGIISPLLANIVLNEFDHWIDGQWANNPVTKNYKWNTLSNGTPNKGHAYEAMKKTKLKEMRIVRYADDVRILCRTKTQANKTMLAAKQWLSERLKLKVSDEKTRVINAKRQYTEFLGLKLKLVKKSGKRVVNSHICDKALKAIPEKLKEQIKRIQRPCDNASQAAEICKYNAMVRGMHSFYAMASHANIDFGRIALNVETTLKNRLDKALSRKGKMGAKSQDYKRYGKSEQLRYIGEAWVLPIRYVQTRNPMCKKVKTNIYTAEGRQGIHEELHIAGVQVMQEMAKSPIQSRSTEYNDNRVSLFAAQYGKCAVTGQEFLSPEEVHCHHKKPRAKGGTDKYQNLVLVLPEVHRLIHAVKQETIDQYLNLLKLTKDQIKKINNLRKMANCEAI